MNTDTRAVAMNERKAKLSTLWIFAVLNYLYCDVMSLMDPPILRQYLTGTVGGIELNANFLLGAALLMEISMAMVLLSRVLPYRVNRWANIIAGTFTTVVQVSTLFFGAGPTLYYAFFSIMENAATAFIVWYAWTWQNPTSQVATLEGTPAKLSHPA